MKPSKNSSKIPKDKALENSLYPGHFTKTYSSNNAHIYKPWLSGGQGSPILKTSRRYVDSVTLRSCALRTVLKKRVSKAYSIKNPNKPTKQKTQSPDNLENPIKHEIVRLIKLLPNLQVTEDSPSNSLQTR